MKTLTTFKKHQSYYSKFVYYYKVLEYYPCISFFHLNNLSKLSYQSLKIKLAKEGISSKEIKNVELFEFLKGTKYKNIISMLQGHSIFIFSSYKIKFLYIVNFLIEKQFKILLPQSGMFIKGSYHLTTLFYNKFITQLDLKRLVDFYTTTSKVVLLHSDKIEKDLSSNLLTTQDYLLLLVSLTQSQSLLINYFILILLSKVELNITNER